jgi:hypothetical protein
VNLICYSMPDLDFLLVLHRSDNVAFGVFKEDQRADCWDVKLWHYDLAAVCLHRLDGIVNRLDTKRALKPIGRLPGYDFASSLQGSLDARIVIGTCFDEEESGRAPRGKLPPECLFIKNPGAVNVVRVDGKVLKIIWHNQKVSMNCLRLRLAAPQCGEALPRRNSFICFGLGPG